MKSLGIWDDSKEAELSERVNTEIVEAVKRAETIEPVTFEDFFETMYAEIPEDLALQQQTMRTSSIGEDPSQIEHSKISQA